MSPDKVRLFLAVSMVPPPVSRVTARLLPKLAVVSRVPLLKVSVPLASPRFASALTNTWLPPLMIVPPV